jgi:cytochrome c5
MKRTTFTLGLSIFLVILTAGISACAEKVDDQAREAEVVEVAEEPVVAEDSEATEEAVLMGDAENGQIIFELGPEGVYEKTCTLCHRLTDLGAYAPGFAGIAERATTRVADLSAEEYLRQSIVDPEAYVVEGNLRERICRRLTGSCTANKTSLI